MLAPCGHATTKLVEDFSLLPKREPLTPLSREETKVARRGRLVRLCHAHARTTNQQSALGNRQSKGLLSGSRRRRKRSEIPLQIISRRHPFAGSRREHPLHQSARRSTERLFRIRIARRKHFGTPPGSRGPTDCSRGPDGSAGGQSAAVPVTLENERWGHCAFRWRFGS